MFDMTFAQRLARVDLSAVMARVVAETGWNAEQAEVAEQMYRQFLTLCGQRKAGQTLVPPQAADEVWHAHVMHTRQYAADCELLFGEFLHHTPGETEDHQAHYLQTLAFYQSQLGADVMAHKDVLGAEYLVGGACKC